MGQEAPPEPPPPSIAPLEAVTRGVGSHDYALSRPDEADRWVLGSGIASARATAGGLGLEFDGDDRFLSRRIFPRARGIAAIEIETAEPTSRPLRLVLQEGGRGSRRRSIDTESLPSDPRVQRVDLSGESWRRLEIAKLRIVPDPSEAALTVKRLTLRPTVGEQRLELGSEARSCMRATSVRTSLQASAGSLLRVGIGSIGMQEPSDEHGELHASFRDAAGRVAEVVERIPIARSAWNDARVIVPTGEPPFGLRLSLRRAPEGDLLESCFEQPDLQTGAEGGSLPNVLLVSLDTFRADHLARAPFLSRLASEGRTFRRVWASSNWTLPSHVSLMTSMPVLEHQVPAIGALSPYWDARIPENQPTLAKQMRRAGYATAASTEAGFMRERYGFGDGFDRFQAFGSTALAPGEAARRHVEFLRRALAARGNRPLFAFVHSFEAHDYFLNTPEYRDLAGPGSDAWASHPSFLPGLRAARTADLPEAYLRDLYAAGIRRIDEVLEEVVAVVREETADAPLLVIVLSDHGESFNEHPDVWHHGSSFFEEQLRVPLVVWSNRDGGLRGEIDVETSLVDVAPSLLAHLGLEVPASFRGERDRFAPQPSAQRVHPVMASHPSVSARSRAQRVDQMLVVDGWKYHRSDRYDGSLIAATCFDLAADPGERVDRLGGDAASCRKFPERLADAFRLFSNGAVLVSATVPLELAGVAAGDEAPIVAVRPTHASREPIARLRTGELRWSPTSPNALLAISPAATAVRLELRRMGGAESDEAIDLRSLRRGETRRLPELPPRADAPSAEFSARGLSFEADEADVEIDPELEDELRALGYVE